MIRSIPDAKSKPFSSGQTWIALAILGAVIALAYSDAFHVPFLLDDFGAITTNPSRLDNWHSLLHPPDDAGVAGRPLLNLSFVLDRALYGNDVRGYHASNLLIHVGAAWILFLLVRQTLLLATRAERGEQDAWLTALAASLLWAVHPLNTISVTYISQRAESLMGLLYLASVYTFARSCTSTSPTRWRTLSVAFCLLGAATKEPIVTAPLLVLLYDRAFVAGTFRNTWNSRRGYYIGMAAAALLVVVSFWMRPVQMVGFASDVSSVKYAVTEGEAVTRYLWLSVFPHPLVFDYGTQEGALTVLAVSYVALVLALVAIVVWQVARNSISGFLGAWFFGILAPTSSIVPVALQPIAESRVYLPSIAIVCLVILGLRKIIGLRFALLIAVGLGLAGTLATYSRNLDFRSEASIWSDTVKKRPSNARAHNNLGFILVRMGRTDDGIAEYQKALALRPEYMKAHYNLGCALLASNKVDEALVSLEKARELQPAYPLVYNNLADARDRKGQFDEALHLREKAASLDAANPELQFNLGTALFQRSQFSGALLAYSRALKLQPDLVEGYYMRALAHRRLKQRDDARNDLQRALELRPAWGPAREELKSLDSAELTSPAPPAAP